VIMPSANSGGTAILKHIPSHIEKRERTSNYDSTCETSEGSGDYSPSRVLRPAFCSYGSRHRLKGQLL
jgi:hypothetical protein